MKRIGLMIAFLLLFAFCVAGCGGTGNRDNKKEETQKVKVVTTIFPEYSWVKEIAGAQEKNVEITLLAKKGVDLHSYRPSVEDILKIANCDLFIYVGGESDAWVEKALQEGKNPKRKAINLMKLLGERVREEETVEGMEKEKHHEHGDKEKHEDHDDHEHTGKQDARHDGHQDKEDRQDDHDKAHREKEHHDKEHHEKEHHDEVEYDEHVWLSLKNADMICRAIAEDLAALDSQSAAAYRANYEAYSKKLAALDAQYKDAIAKAPVKTVLFGDRFPFRYLADDYGLTYFAAFKGCSAETEASFETVAFLARKTEELKLPAVLAIERRQHKLAQTIADNTKSRNQKILTMNSMQSVTEDEVKNGASYLKVMEANLKVLKEALQSKGSAD